MSGGTIVLNLDYKGKSTILTVNTDWTTAQLYEWVAKTVHANVADFYIQSQGTMLTDMTKPIRDYRFVHQSTITYVIRTAGGSRLRGSRLQPLENYVKLTDEACLITCDDNPREKRAKMYCGCVLAAETVKSHIDVLLEKGESEFKCPSCGNDWEFFVVTHVLSAVLSEAELQERIARADSNYRDRPQHDIRQCGNCKSYCMRDFKRTWLNFNRVNCLGCANDFCWICGKLWRDFAGETCGNAECQQMIQERLDALSGCTTKTIGTVPGCPDIRACPRCGILITHTKACKHMTCASCKCEFCFICMKIKESDGNWHCGSSSAICPIAPRQTTLPNWTKSHTSP